MQNPLIFSLCAFLMLMTVLSWVGYRIFYKPGRFLKQLGTPVINNEAGRTASSNESQPEGSTVVTFLQQLGSKMPSSGPEAANLKAELLRAGYRSDQAAPVFYGIRILSTLAMLGLTFAMQSKIGSNPSMSVAVVVFGDGCKRSLPVSTARD